MGSEENQKHMKHKKKKKDKKKKKNKKEKNVKEQKSSSLASANVLNEVPVKELTGENLDGASSAKDELKHANFIPINETTESTYQDVVAPDDSQEIINGLKQASQATKDLLNAEREYLTPPDPKLLYSEDGSSVYSTKKLNVMDPKALYADEKTLAEGKPLSPSHEPAENREGVDQLGIYHQMGDMIGNGNVADAAQDIMKTMDNVKSAMGIKHKTSEMLEKDHEEAEKIKQKKIDNARAEEIKKVIKQAKADNEIIDPHKSMQKDDNKDKEDKEDKKEEKGE